MRYLHAVHTFSIFAVAAPGLEAVLAAELASLGWDASIAHGGVEWEGTIDDVARANLEVRTASRILVRCDVFRARTFHELERRARRVEWMRFVASNEDVRLRITCRKSALYHEGAVAERLLDAIAQSTGRRGTATADPEGDTEDGQLFVVRMFRDICTISADSSGPLLHRRGYRQAVARAPLRETTAAAMLLASTWTPGQPLLDPLCGSGTIPIEAALIARRIAPGLARPDRTPRPFRFLEWPGAGTDAWNNLVQQANARILPHCPAPIIASDRNAGAMRAATANAERAGVSSDIEFATRPLDAVTRPTDGGAIVTNPPWGKRIGGKSDSGRIVRQLDSLLDSEFSGWTLATLVPGRTEGAVFETRNGGIPVSLRIR